MEATNCIWKGPFRAYSLSQMLSDGQRLQPDLGGAGFGAVKCGRSRESLYHIAVEPTARRHQSARSRPARASIPAFAVTLRPASVGFYLRWLVRASQRRSGLWLRSALHPYVPRLIIDIAASSVAHYGPVEVPRPPVGRPPDDETPATDDTVLDAALTPLA